MGKKRQYTEVHFNPSRYRYLVGVDCSFYNMGLSIVDLENKNMPPRMIQGDLDDCLQELARYRNTEALLVVEHLKTGYLPRRDPGTVVRIAGAIHASKYFCYLLEKYGYVYLKVDPGQRDRMDKHGRKKKRQVPHILLAKMPTKITDQQYYELTGHYGNFSEHCKDAYTLIHDRKPAEILTKIKIQLQKENSK